jgi:HPt (histidine-containing phosphotransfer) domain-containing protein
VKPGRTELYSKILYPGGNQMEPSLNPDTIAALREMDEPGSHAFLSEIIDAYLSDTRIRMDVLRSCIGTKDAVGIAKAAHAIKGSSLNIGAERMAALMHAIERQAKAGDDAVAVSLKEAGIELELVVSALQACLA